MAARKKRYMRYPRTTSEKRAYYKCPDLVRPNRHANRLPDAYDDKLIRHSHSWKKIRRTQYRDKSSQKWCWRYIILHDDCSTNSVLRQCCFCIEKHLQACKYYYELIYGKLHSHKSYFIIRWYGPDIGRW